MIRRMFMVLIAVSLTVAGAIGAYDFARNGAESPLVWAMQGRLAPLLWIAIFGIVIWSLMQPYVSSRFGPEA
jgi:hypothetical protein